MAAQDLPKAQPGSGRAFGTEEHLDEKPQYEEATTFSDPVPIPKEQGRIYAGSISDDDSEALEQNPFLDPDVASHWTTVYEKSQYECRHVFDPSLNWTKEEEKKLVRRLDWHVCLWAVSLVNGIISERGADGVVYYVLRPPGRSRKSGAGCFRQLPGRPESEHQW